MTEILGPQRKEMHSGIKPFLLQHLKPEVPNLFQFACWHWSINKCLLDTNVTSALGFWELSGKLDRPPGPFSLVELASWWRINTQKYKFTESYNTMCKRNKNTIEVEYSVVTYNIGVKSMSPRARLLLLQTLTLLFAYYLCNLSCE